MIGPCRRYNITKSSCWTFACRSSLLLFALGTRCLRAISLLQLKRLVRSDKNMVEQIFDWRLCANFAFLKFMLDAICKPQAEKIFSVDKICWRPVNNFSPVCNENNSRSSENLVAKKKNKTLVINAKYLLSPKRLSPAAIHYGVDGIRGKSSVSYPKLFRKQMA